jgi:hypothetical protein
MNEDTLSLPAFTKADMLESLKPYQREAIAPLLEQHSEEEVAQIWLSSNGPSGNAKFGGVPTDAQPFWDRVKEEFRMLICGDEKYAALRAAINDKGKPSAQAIIGVASLHIAAQLGVATALIAPAISLLLYLAVSLGINAWCAA